MSHPDRIQVLLEAHDPMQGAAVYDFSASDFGEVRDLDYAVGTHVRDDAGRLLLVRNGWSDGWINPGGGVEPGETLRAAARREVREETGVVAEIGAPLYVEEATWDYGDRQTDAYFVAFEGRALDPNIEHGGGVDEEEIRDVGWFDAEPPEGLDPMMADRHPDGLF